MADLLCPFDKVELVRLEDHYNIPYYHCPNCNQEYSRYEVNRLDKIKAERIDSAKIELEKLDERRSELVKLLNLAQRPASYTERGVINPNSPVMKGNLLKGMKVVVHFQDKSGK